MHLSSSNTKIRKPETITEIYFTGTETIKENNFYSIGEAFVKLQIPCVFTYLTQAISPSEEE